jgi:hypothetical protein
LFDWPRLSEVERAIRWWWAASVRMANTQAEAADGRSAEGPGTAAVVQGAGILVDGLEEEAVKGAGILADGLVEEAAEGVGILADGLVEEAAGILAGGLVEEEADILADRLAAAVEVVGILAEGLAAAAGIPADHLVEAAGILAGRLEAAVLRAAEDTETAPGLFRDLLGLASEAAVGARPCIFSGAGER